MVLAGLRPDLRPARDVPDVVREADREQHQHRDDADHGDALVDLAGERPSAEELDQRAKRFHVAREVYERVSVIGIVAMLMLFAIGLSNDVGHITSGPQIGP
jgi:hypothetical protein